MRRLLSRLIATFVQARRERDLSAELESHLRAHIDDNVRAGMTLDEARRDALLRLGGIDQTAATYREQRGLPMLENTVRELRHALTRLMRSPGFTGATVLSLALAIGANIAIFAVVERVVINPLPYPRSQRLVALDFGMPARNVPAGFNSMTVREYFYYAANSRTMESIAVSRTEDRTLTGGGAAERLRVARTTPSLATVLRVAPEAGSWLPQDRERGPAPVAVLSHGLWIRRFGGDPSILGRSVTLNGVATTVVGVMPSSFAYPDARVDLWIPEPFLPATSDDSYSYNGVARVRDGVSVDAVRAEINQLTRSLHGVAPGNGYDALVATTLSLHDATVGNVAAALWILLASAAV
ncbi:MAG TPA: ABC transporter permease, partial [Vicinamibacterales bacterium]|nr:ABC transporter permease [Vicinamibacterales bacterium]